MPQNKKHLILKAFEDMNISMLELLLDGTKTYFGATKEVFLGKLSYVFLVLKCNKGITCLVFDEEEYTPPASPSDFGKRKICFLGKIDGIYKWLFCYTFEESETDFVNIYTNTYLGYEIDVFEDEKADFEPSVDFLIQSQIYIEAHNELMQNQKTIGKEIYTEWYSKHKQTYESLEKLDFEYQKYAVFNDFADLYLLVETAVKATTIYEPVVKIAIEEYINEQFPYDEPQLLKWLVRYEQLYEKRFFVELNVINPCLLKQQNDFILYKSLKIFSSDFAEIIKFECGFDKHYREMFEKYRAFNVNKSFFWEPVKGREDEVSILKETAFDDFFENEEIANSLSYHLKIRGII